MKKIAESTLFDHNKLMIEKTDSTQLSTELSFTLDVRIPEQLPRKISVEDRILAGIDPRNDLILIDSKIKTKHFLFRKRNNILTVDLMGPSGETTINGIALEKGKIYILEKGDVIKVGKIEIIIRRETQISKGPKTIAPSTEKVEPAPYDFKALEDETEEIPDEPIEDDPVYQEFRPQREKTNDQVDQFKKGPSLIPYRIYGFVIDVSFTYFILSIIVPLTGLKNLLLEFLYPVSQFLMQDLALEYGYTEAFKFLSFFEFFVFFHLVMIVSSLLFGLTPGALILGVHHREKKQFITKRFKAYIYALINIVALPLIVFDIPLFKGRTLKEFLTLTHHELKDTPFFKFQRKVLSPILIVLTFLSPVFLPEPYNSAFSAAVIKKPKYIDTQTQTIKTRAFSLGLVLRTELNNNYALLPLFENKKFGLILYDLKNNLALTLREEKRIPLEHAYFALRFPNPLMGFYLSGSEPSPLDLKNKVLKSLQFSLDNLAQGFNNFGPFASNAFLFKEYLVSDFKTKNDFLYYDFNEDNPVLLVQTNQDNTTEEKVFLFADNYLLQFDLRAPKKGRLTDVFLSSVLASLRYENSGPNEANNVGILEAIDAFERSSYRSLLTYYANEAKKADTLNNYEWTQFLKKNIETMKRALFIDKTRKGLTKTLEESIDDIINSLDGKAQ